MGGQAGGLRPSDMGGRQNLFLPAGKRGTVLFPKIKVRGRETRGEQVAGFKDVHTGKFTEVMLIRGANDLNEFKKTYGIRTEIVKEY